VRYKNFLALGSDSDAKAKADEMKRKGDFTTPGVNSSQIAATKAEGSPVDAFLSTNDVKEGESAARWGRSLGLVPKALCMCVYVYVCACVYVCEVKRRGDLHV